MILTCDNCHARYLVSAHAIGTDGRRVRCSACGHEWFQPEGEQAPPSEPYFPPSPPPVEEPIPESVKPLPEEIAPLSLKPAMKEPNRKRAALATAACIVLAVIGLSIPARARIIETWPPAMLLYNTFGLTTPFPGQGLTIENVKAVSALNEKGIRIIKIDGRIANPKDKEAKIPSLEISLTTPGEKGPDHWTIHPSKMVLLPHQDETFSTTYPEPAGGAKDVTVRFVVK